MSESVVYAIAAGDSVKIGYTTNLEQRMKAIQSTCPHPIVCLGTAPGGQLLERALHRQFARHRVYGEWFDLPPDQRDALRRRLSGEPHFIQLPRAGKREMYGYPKRNKYERKRR